jgi:hypothetical protein
MKRISCVLVLVLACLAFSAQRTTRAVGGHLSANGDFQFVLEDGNRRYVQFNASVEGNNHGTMSFSDPTATPDDATTPGVQITATFDCVKVQGNRAVMGGVISSSNILGAIDRRVLLVVEDNGEGVNASAPDRLTWGIYENPTTGWTPKDFERDDDNGAILTWLATDFERPDDPGIPSNQSKIVRCDSFPLSTYSFVDVDHGNGNIQVKPN